MGAKNKAETMMAHRTCEHGNTFNNKMSTRDAGERRKKPTRQKKKKNEKRQRKTNEWRNVLQNKLIFQIKM